jgi:hypothetical protein
MLLPNRDIMNNLLTNVKSQNTPNANSSVRICTIHAARLPRRVLGMRIAAGVAAVLLAACGGGNAASPNDQLLSSATSAQTTAASTVTVGVITPVTPTVPVTVFTPTPTVTAGAVITDIRIQNTGLAQTFVPFTFGQVFAVGHLLPKEGLAAKLENGTVLRLQTDIKATHADGSVRHAVISGVLPALAAGQTQTIQLAKSSVAEQSTVTPQSLINAGLTGSVNVTVNNVKYSAALAGALASPTSIKWLSGPIANEWIVSAPLLTADGVAHPHLTARFDVRSYPTLSKQARVEVVVENNKTFTGGAQNFTYDVNVELAGRTVYSQANLTHYHHARWRKLAWWDALREPATHLKHNTAYLIATKAVSNYDQSVVAAENELAAYANQLTAAITGPMTIGPLVSYMPSTGGRVDIGSLPSWSVMYLLSMDKRAKDSMMAVAEGSGTWSIHYRDEATGFPIRVDNDANKRVSMHENLNHMGPLPVPRCANNDFNLCKTPYTPDTAHQPSMAYLPYLVTGDYYYLEELQFWAAWNPLGTDPGYSGMGLGLLRWQQLRGQAWSLRTLGHAAYITPDSHFMKAYFNKQLDNNLDYYHATFVVANPNQLGVYDGSGVASFETPASAPWQDDFFTWSFGYLSELGFAKAQPILEWKAKYPVGRMSAPGFCWIEASSYFLLFRDSPTTPLYSTFAQLYEANFKNDNIRDDNSVVVTHPGGLKFLDQPCASQAQADWLAAATRSSWVKGQMAGYAGYEMGYPANMQPALAVAVAAGVPNAAAAWSTFASRGAKPNYSKAPQWAIIPR